MSKPSALRLFHHYIVHACALHHWSKKGQGSNIHRWFNRQLQCWSISTFQTQKSTKTFLTILLSVKRANGTSIRDGLLRKGLAWCQTQVTNPQVKNHSLNSTTSKWFDSRKQQWIKVRHHKKPHLTLDLSNNMVWSIDRLVSHLGGRWIDISHDGSCQWHISPQVSVSIMKLNHPEHFGPKCPSSIQH